MLVNTLMLIGISVAWAAGYLFIRDADSALPPLTSTAAMALVAAVVMMVAVPALRRPFLQPLSRLWVPLTMAVTAVALPILATTQAETNVTAGMAAVLGTTVPIATLLLTVFVTRQTTLTPSRSFGVLLALAGLIVFAGWQGLMAHESEALGILTMMAGSLVFAVNGLFVAKQARDLDPYALAAWTMMLAAVVLTVAALVIDGVPPLPPGHVVASLAGEGAIGMGLAYLGYYALVARAGAYFASLYAFLVPPFGVLASALVFHEAITATHVVGLAIVLIGLGLIVRPDGTGQHSSPPSQQLR